MKAESRFLATTAAGMVALAVLLVLTGIALDIPYKPTIAEAYHSAQQLRTGWFWGSLTRFHYWGGQLLVLVSAIHLTTMVWFGQYRKSQIWQWLGTLVIFLCAFTWCVTGNALPFDRHGVQSAVIEASVAARTPIFGEDARTMLLQGQDFSVATLQGWYFMHRWILPALFVLGIFGAIVAHIRSNTAKESRVWMWWPVFLTIVCAAVWAAPSGPGATSSDYQALLARPNWYAWPLHGSLRLFDVIQPGWGWIGSALVPGVFFGFLLALPIIGSKAATMLVNVVYFGFLCYFGVAAYFFGHDFAPLTGWRDPGTLAVPKTAKRVIETDPVLVLAGAKVYTVQKCGDCHLLAGKGYRVGPNLDGVGKRLTDREWLAHYIKDPASVRKGSTMPASPKISDADMRALVEYLVSQK